jgi:hypothetical protein
MSQINPFTGSVLQAPQVQRQQATDKDKQLRRAVDQEKNSALQGDRLEHQVESAEELAEIHDQDTPDPRKRKKQPHGDDENAKDAGDDEQHLDVTA